MVSWLVQDSVLDLAMKAALYARVSTTDKAQDPAYQVDALVALAERQGYEPVPFVEHGVSGAKESRPELDKLMGELRRGKFKALMVWKLDRLGRSLPHLLQIVHECELHGVQFFSLTEGMDTTTPIGKLLFNIIGSLAEFERTLIAERVKAGMEHAKKHGTKSGKRIGRPAKKVDFATIYDAVYEAKMTGAETLTDVAERFGVSRGWIYDHVIPLLQHQHS